jgi:hypothetical protein
MKHDKLFRGINCITEADGLRIVTSLGEFFLERVDPKVIDTFKIASISPAAKILNAMKYVD